MIGCSPSLFCCNSTQARAGAIRAFIFGVTEAEKWAKSVWKKGEKKKEKRKEKEKEQEALTSFEMNCAHSKEAIQGGQ